MASTPSNIPGYDSKHCDGRPGMEYFADGYAFAWTGASKDLIEVSPGAYSEAVEWIIPSSPIVSSPFSVLADAHTPWILAQFQHACDEWLAWNDRRNQPRAKHIPVWNYALKAEVCEVCLVPTEVIPADFLKVFGNYVPAQWEDCLGD